MTTARLPDYQIAAPGLRHQLADCDRVHHRSRQNVSADECTFLDYGDLEFADQITLGRAIEGRKNLG